MSPRPPPRRAPVPRTDRTGSPRRFPGETPRESSFRDLLVGIGGPASPPFELFFVGVEILPTIVGRELIRLGGQPDRFRLGRAPRLAQAAEHAALEVDVETVELLFFLPRRLVQFLVPIDVDDVDRAIDRAEVALDAAFLVEPEHAAEPVRRRQALLRILHRLFLPKESAAGDAEPREQVEQQKPVEETLPRGQRLTSRARA